jgi:hypothetical protein
MKLDSSFTSFTPTDFDWVDILGNFPKANYNVDPLSPLFPLSPPSSSSDVTAVEVDGIPADFPDFFPQPVVRQSLVINANFLGSTGTASSPTDSENPTDSPTRKSSPDDRPDTLPSEPPRRGRGRPSKAQLAQNPGSKHVSGRSSVIIRRRFHNDSATRSRAKFNTALEELWNEVPESRRILSAKDPLQVSRAEKIEIIISYIRSLRECVNNVRKS